MSRPSSPSSLLVFAALFLLVTAGAMVWLLQTRRPLRSASRSRARATAPKAPGINALESAKATSNAATSPDSSAEDPEPIPENRGIEPDSAAAPEPAAAPATSRQVRDILDRFQEAERFRDFKARAQALEQMRALGPGGALLLSRALLDTETSYGAKLAILGVLRRMGDPAAAPALREFLFQRRQVLSGPAAPLDQEGSHDETLFANAALLLAELEGGPARLFIEHQLLFSRNPRVSRSLLDSLDRVATAKSEPALQAFLATSKDTRAKVYAVRILGRITAQYGVGPLARVLAGDQPALVRAAAVRGISSRGGARALDVLSERLQVETDEDVRVAIVGALGSIPSPRTVALVEAALDEGRPQRERVQAVRALSRVNPGRAAVVLRRVLQNDNDGKVASAALVELARMNVAGLEALLAARIGPEQPPGVHDAAMVALMRRFPNEANVGKVGQVLLGASEERTRAAAARALRDASASPLAPRLLRDAALNDSSPRVRAAALSSLAKLRGADVRPFIKERAAGDPSSHVRGQAARLLTALGRSEQ